MKAIFLAAILPCAVLAEESAPISFMSVKPVAEVAADAAEPVPEDALKALKDARAAKDWETVLKSADKLLALPRTATADRLAWTEMRREAFENLGKWDDALAASMAELAYPMDSNKVHNVRMRVIRYLKDKLARTEDGVRLGEEILDDGKTAPDKRAEAALAAAATVNQVFKDGKRAEAILAKADALPTSMGVRSNVRWQRIWHVMHYMGNPPDKGDRIRALSTSAITNSAISASMRAKCAATSLEWYRGVDDKERKLIPVPLARSLLAEKIVPPAEAAQLECEILKNMWGAGEEVRPQAVAMAETLVANTNSPASYRVHAATLLAGMKRKAGDKVGADRLLESCYRFKGCTPEDMETVAKAIAYPLFLEDRCDAVVEAYREPLRYNDTQAMQVRVDKLVVDAYSKFYRMEDVRDYWLSRGRRIEAARVCQYNLDDSAMAERLYKEVIEDPKASFAEHLEAWAHYMGNADLCERYLPVVLTGSDKNTNEVARAIERRIWESKPDSAAYVGNYAQVVRLYGIYERIRKTSPRQRTFQLMQYAAFAYCGLRDFDAAVKICREAIDEGVAKSPADIFQFNMMAALLTFKGDEAAALKALREADAKYRGDLDDKTHLSRLDRLGSAALIGALDPLARAVAENRKSLFAKWPKREYVVHFSEKPITGPEGWDSLSFVPETQLMDREYGGNYKFLLETDVGTGNRGEGIGSEKDREDGKVPAIQIACDARGIHFRFEAPDEKAREVAAGLAGAGSFEAYVAAGENQPYYCLLMDIAPKATVSVWNTTFSTAGHRRIGSDDQSLCKSETAFTDPSTISYIRLSWNAFSTLIPENGSVWEFENLHWGRADQAAWNGVESAHGRSQWGRLVFDLPPRARIEILKGVVFDARRIYMGAKAAYSMGPVDRWRDPVLGDGDFYDQCVAPLLERLDAYLPLVTADMADEDVLKVAEEAVPGWRDIRHEVARLRAQYLRRKFSK
jgi:hypothetical protein